MADNESKPTVIIIKEQSDNKLLRFVLFTWLFGIFYWGWLALKWCTIGSWRLLCFTWRWTVTYPVKWSIALTRWSMQMSRRAWPYVVRGVQAFHARYSWRGWAIVAAVVVVLGIVGSIINR